MEQPHPRVKTGGWVSVYPHDGRPGGRESQPEIGEDMIFKGLPSVTNISQSDLTS